MNLKYDRSDVRPITINICGTSGVGKSSVARKIMEVLTEAGFNVIPSDEIKEASDYIGHGLNQKICINEVLTTRKNGL